LKLTNLEGAIRALKEIQEQVDKLKERIGVQKKVGNEDLGTQQSTQGPTLTIEDMRHFKELLSNTPPEQRAVLIKMYRADDAAISALSPVFGG